MKHHLLAVLVVLVVTGCGGAETQPETPGQACHGSSCLDVGGEDVCTAESCPPDADSDGDGAAEDATTEEVDSAVEPDAPVEQSGPCLLVSGAQGVEFGDVPLGRPSSRTVTFTNCSTDSDLELSSIVLRDGSDPQFTIGALPAGLPTAPLTIRRGGAATVVLDYAPVIEGVHEGTLEIRSNDTHHDPMLIPVHGVGVNACPVAVARARVQQNEGEPEVPWSDDLQAPGGSVIELDASMSTDPDEPGSPTAISHYGWRYLVHPRPTAPALTSDAGGGAQFRADVLGDYEIELQVTDVWEKVGCEPARVAVHAVPGSRIVVEVTWDNPADPDQDDRSGSDVDVHFLKMGPGRWFNSPYDAYFGNREPFFNPEHPSLTVDDPNGAGPEVIQLDDPADCQWYAVGIHYWRQQFGIAYTTTRIFVDSVMAFEARDKPLATTGEWWDVARIHWPSGQVFLVDTLDAASPTGMAAPVTDGMVTSELCGVDELLGN